MKTQLFDFDIPQHLIAQCPLKKRSDSKLLVYNRKEDSIKDSNVINITDFLDENNFLVFNNSKVLPVRLTIINKFGASIEALIIKKIDLKKIIFICENTKKYKINDFFDFPSCAKVYVEDLSDGTITVVSGKPIFSNQYFIKYGKVPLPPYIRKSIPDKSDFSRYQTVYSKHYGSSAAPTAGLHFDQAVLKKVKKKK